MTEFFIDMRYDSSHNKCYHFYILFDYQGVVCLLISLTIYFCYLVSWQRRCRFIFSLLRRCTLLHLLRPLVIRFILYSLVYVLWWMYFLDFIQFEYFHLSSYYRRSPTPILLYPSIISFPCFKVSSFYLFRISR